MSDELELKDISEELVIINKHTIDALYSLENGADCIALYVFFYKTAKWQKTNSIKANEEYIKKSLGWGYDRIRRAKTLLKENGLIQMVQNRKENKIEGWYIQISYLVSQNATDKIKVINTYEKQEVVNPTSRDEEINALKYNINILENNINMLKEENNILKNKLLNKENNNNKNNNNKESILKEIFDYWNKKQIIKHNELTDARKKAILKALKENSADDIKLAIEHYNIILKDTNYFFSYVWSLEDFLNRKTGYTTFLNEGSNWVNYNKPKVIKQNNGLVDYEIDLSAPYHNRGDNDIY